MARSPPSGRRPNAPVLLVNARSCDNGAQWFRNEQRGFSEALVTDLNVLCDDCLVTFSISAIPMTRADPGTLISGWGETPLGDGYQCRCGRFYASVVGYYTGVQGRPVQRRRTGPQCPDHFRPMYISRVLTERRATFACPECDHTRDEDVGEL